MSEVEVGVRDLRNHTKKVIEQIDRGDSVVLTRRGKPIARITPIHDRPWGVEALASVDRVLDGVSGDLAGMRADIAAADELALELLDEDGL
jgi:prevent-host-death family protein